MSEESKELVLKVLNCEDKATQKMLFGYYKPRLSDAQIEFIEKKLGIFKPKLDQGVMDFVEGAEGWKIVNDK